MARQTKLKRGSQLQKLIQQVRKLNRQTVEVGHFASQGKHETSGMTYPELMKIHHTGNPEINMPARPVLSILSFRIRQLTNIVFGVPLKAWGRRQVSDSSDRKLLNDMGAVLREQEKLIFGSTVLAPNAVPPKAFNNPLILTGDLKSKVAYKTSLDNQVKEG